MQTDMHYYGVYVLARMAGLKPGAAGVMAYASQYVDDAVACRRWLHPQGGRLQSEVSAHHAGALANLDGDDQRRVWVPFHFFPGGQGQNLDQRLVCLEDGPLLNQMLDHHLALAPRVPFGLELLGVASHAYADSFSHWGFSGVSSRLNTVDNASIEVVNAEQGTAAYLARKRRSFYIKYTLRQRLSRLWQGLQERFLGGLAEAWTSGLGHGAVLTYPDLPYLVWRFRYQYGPNRGVQERDNPAHFELGCQRLFQFFRRAAKALPQHYQGSHAAFGQQARQTIQGILLKQEGRPERSLRWRQALSKSRLFASQPLDHKLPVYSRLGWDRQLEGFPRLDQADQMSGQGVYRFFQAASLHRRYVLRELLPVHGIMLT